MSEGLGPALAALFEARFRDLSKPLRKNLVALTLAFLQVLAAVRSGNGRLSLAALARALPTPGNAKAREKRLARFLKNLRLDFRTVTSSLAAILLAGRKGLCPVILDPTRSGSAEALVAAVPYAGRALPLACYTFAYPLAEPALKSQNQLEHLFLLEVEGAFPPKVTPVWIADRGLARSLLLQQSQQEERLYILRGRREVVITYRGRRMKLHELHAPPRRVVRYENVLYHSERKVPVDVTVYGDPNYQQPWYLLTRPALRPLLPAERVVELYRERMQIEQSFRDFKTHLGLRGLKLQVEVAPRMGRLLLAFCLSYILCVLLGDSRLGDEARALFEIPRRFPRHGTCRTLSALSLAMLMLSHPKWLQRCLAFLLKLLALALRGQPLLPASVLIKPPRAGP